MKAKASLDAKNDRGRGGREGPEELEQVAGEWGKWVVSEERNCVLFFFGKFGLAERALVSETC